MPLPRSIAPALACIVLTISAFAQPLSIPSVKDNTLYEDALGAFSSGAGTGIFVGRVGNIGGTEIRRGLLRFNPAASIPVGSTITAVTLRLYMNKTMAGAKSIALHRTLADWGEGTSVGEGSGALATPDDATWIHRFYNNTLWSTPGGNFAPMPSAATSVAAAGFYEWSGPGLIADVQAWLDNPATNFGWTLLGDESTPQTAKRFASREWFFVNERPALLVEFTPPTPACYPDCDLDGGLTIDDFICFQTLFALNDPAADCDADTILTIDDFICFQTLFAIGC